MDISSFLGGNFLTHFDLPQQSQVWTIREVRQELVGSDQKIVTYFGEHQKGLGLNKVNLRTIAEGYSTNSQGWPGRQLELYKDQTQFQGKTVPCIRVRIPQQPPPPAMPQQPAPVQQPAVAVQPALAQPPFAAAAPVAAPQPLQPAQQPAAPWEQPQQQNNPPSA